MSGGTDQQFEDGWKERKTNRWELFWGNVCSESSKASSTLHVKCRGKDMKAEAPTQPYDKIKSNPQNLFDEDFLNRLLSAHFI